MAAYRAAKEELADERELRQKAEAECVKLRVDLAKLVAKERAAAALATAETELKELRRAKGTLQADFDEAQ
eukprot:3984155-Pleurochrysis_carterae.AAC.1